MVVLPLLVGLAAVAWSAPPPSAPPAPKLGTHPGDRTDLAESPVLRHLAGSLPEGSPRTPADLLADRSTRYLTAPDPTALFRAEAAASPAPPADHPLKLLTYNVGLLDTRWLLGLRRAQMPEVGIRRSALPQRLLSDGWDVLLLQEVWSWADVVRFAEAAEREGYVWFAGSERKHSTHGLMILVKGSIIDGAQRRTEGLYDAQERHWLGGDPPLGAGYLTWSFTHRASQRPVRIATTRLFDGRGSTAWHTRSLQARQLGIDLAETSPDTVVVLGGDLGAGPYHSEDVLGAIHGREDADRWQDSTTWALLRHYGGLVDAATWARDAEDIAAVHALPEWTKGWTQRPLYGWCEQLTSPTFTATDCNPLHFIYHRGDRMPARREQIHLRMTDEQGAFQAPELQYVDPEPVRGRPMPLSPHYGVGLDIQLR